MSPQSSAIFIIDDDASVLRALGRVMKSAGLHFESFSSVEDFLSGAALDATGCVIADMTLRGMSGLELKKVLNAAHSELPVIFLTADDTSEMRAAASEAGATGYFRKPVDTQALLDAIQWTMASSPPVRAA